MSTSRECPLCLGAVLWGITLAGVRIPMDPAPTPDGNLIRVAVGYAVRLQVLDGNELPWLGDVTHVAGPYRAHEKTCTKVARRTKQPACRDCGHELHPIIVARGGDLHWLCGGVARPAAIEPASAPAEPDLLDIPEAS